MTRYPLNGKTVLITGAARGIGRQLARELSGRGAKVAATDIDTEALADLEQEIGAPARAWRMDVRDWESVETVTRAAAVHYGHLDVVIANAGLVSFPGTFETVDPAHVDRLLDVNLLGVYRTFNAALPQVLRTRGYLLAVASSATGLGGPLKAHYAASKAAAAAMCNELRLELRWTGVGVGVLYPTAVATPDAAGDDPVSAELNRIAWAGNSAVDRAYPVEKLARAVAAGIERRRRTIVVPARAIPLIYAPGLIRPLLEKTFSDEQLERLTRRARELARRPAGQAGVLR